MADPELLGRRPVAVKIDNAPGARPQAGLADACIVYEHLAEGGISRFTAIFHTEDADLIGPVRSARRLDLSLVPQFQAIFAHVGGSQTVMAQLRTSGILDLDQFWYADAYYRSRERYSPFNVYTSLARLLRAAAARGWEGPVGLPPYEFLIGDAAPISPTVSQIVIPLSLQQVVEYRYDRPSNSYIRFQGGEPHRDASTGEQIRVKNVIVQYVKVWVVGIVEDINGAPSLDFELVGEGRASVFRDGQVLPARWVRPSIDVPTRYLDLSGRPITFRPGNIWVALVPLGTEVVQD